MATTPTVQPAVYAQRVQIDLWVEVEGTVEQFDAADRDDVTKAIEAYVEGRLTGDVARSARVHASLQPSAIQLYDPRRHKESPIDYGAQKPVHVSLSRLGSY